MFFYGKDMVMPKERSSIEIRIAGLSTGVHEFEFTCRAEDFNDTELTEKGFTRDISVKAEVEKFDSEITVALTTSTTADFNCDICLSPIAKDLKGFYKVYYVYGEAGEREESDNDEEYRLIDNNTLSIDLTEDVRETLLLSVPMKVTCTDNPDCRLYLGQKPGETEKTDRSSWQESLEKLKNKYR
jgi:uncharacterized protein